MGDTIVSGLPLAPTKQRVAAASPILFYACSLLLLGACPLCS